METHDTVQRLLGRHHGVASPPDIATSEATNLSCVQMCPLLEVRHVSFTSISRCFQLYIHISSLYKEY
jgi:hypothetical protein